MYRKASHAIMVCKIHISGTLFVLLLKFNEPLTNTSIIFLIIKQDGSWKKKKKKINNNNWRGINMNLSITHQSML